MTAERLASVDLHRVRMPLRRAHRAAHGTEVDREVVLVRVELASGGFGWGECSALARPTYAAEYTGGAWAMLREFLVPAALAGDDVAVVGHPMASAALATAVTDARLRANGDNLARVLSGADGPRRVPWTAVIGTPDSVDDAHEQVAARLAAGAAQIKLKVGRRELDLSVVESVRATWPELALAVDCNGTATPALLERLDRLDLAYIEQPAPADGLVQSAAWAASLDTPLALDESITSIGAMDAVVALAAGRVVNLKPARLGGPLAAARAVDVARNRGLHPFIGGMLETGVGRAAALAVAAKVVAADPGPGLATDLGPSATYFAADVTAPIEVDESGQVEVPSAPGIGCEPQPDRLAEVTVDHVQLVA